MMKKYECMMCGWIYDEALGDPDEDIAPGTAWEDIPEAVSYTHLTLPTILLV